MNGWNRLWVVVSVFYLFAVVFPSVISWPKTTHVEELFLNEIHKRIDASRFFSLSPEEKHKFLINRNQGYGALPPEEQKKVIARIGQKELDVAKLLHEKTGYEFSNLVREANRRGLFNKPKPERSLAEKIRVRRITRKLEGSESEKLIASGNWVGLAVSTISKYKGDIDFSEEQDRYEMELSSVNSERKEVVFRSFLFWFFPVIVLYALGYSVGWVVRGFKGKNRSN